MASERVQDFIERLGPSAVALGAEYGLDPALIIAQSALETGWGKSASGNNYFGVKSHGQPGGQTLLTYEEINGKMVPVYDSFRVYDDASQSMRDYAQFLKDNPRYKDVFGQPNTNSAIDAVAAAGYATDSNYADKLKAVARMIDLSKYQTPRYADVALPRPRPNTVPNSLMSYAGNDGGIMRATLPKIGPTGGPALNAINAAAPPARTPDTGNLWSNPFAAIKTNVRGIMGTALPQTQSPGFARSLMNVAMASPSVRSAYVKSLMNQNIGKAPSVVQGHVPGGSQVMAVNAKGSTPVTLMGSSSAGSQAFDRDIHAGQNMDVYRANRESIGDKITKDSIEKALSSGATLYRP